MEIKPTYATSEQAKLLKEKGFDELCQFYYYDLKKGHTLENVLQENKSPYCNGIIKEKQHFQTFNAPEQWQVVEWLRINHGIWVDVSNIKRFKYSCQVTDLNTNENDSGIKFSKSFFETPQEAYSSAFDYVLRELI